MGTVVEGKIKRVREMALRFGRPFRLMEVCGTHTVAVYRNGFHNLFAGAIDFISGPGCPVCVTHQSYIDTAIKLAEKHTVYSFGDLLRVPGKSESLSQAQGRGAKVKIMTSPLEAVQQAKLSGDPSIIAAVGFETTTPTFALAVEMCEQLQLKNLQFLIELKTMEEPLRFLFNRNPNIDGLILPGHVASIIGTAGFRFVENYKIPSVVAGFEGIELIIALERLSEKIISQDYEVENKYSRVVSETGNLQAQEKVRRFFQPAEAWFRGIGMLEGAGLALRPDFQIFQVTFDYQEELNTACRCADVLTGIIKPFECKLFGKACNPSNPAGACMVSSEGSCSAYYRYGRDR